MFFNLEVIVKQFRLATHSVTIFTTKIFFFRKKSLPKDLRSKISSEVIKIKTEKGEEEKKAAARRKRENEADQVLS